MFLVESSQ